MPETTKCGDSPNKSSNKNKDNEWMFASVCTKYGKAREVFEIRENVPKPVIAKANQILVRTKYTTVNPADCKQRSGNLKLVAKHDFPLVLGQDFLGQVVEIGSKVSQIQVGQVVMGSTAPRNSCAAQYLVCFEHECVDVDDAIQIHDKDNTKDKSNERTSIAAMAAACPTAYCTAWKGLFDIGRLPSQDEKQTASNKNTNHNVAKSILIVGASGSVGSAAVQLAVGIASNIDTVVAICGSDNLQYVQSLGNSDTKVVAVDYKQPSYQNKLLQKNNGQTFDLILDCVGGDDYYYKLHPFLNFDNPKAKYVTCVGPVLHGGSEPITYRTLLSTVCALVPRLLGNYCLFGMRNSRYQIYLGFDTIPLPYMK